MTAPVGDASIYTDLSSLTKLKAGAQAQDPAAIKEVAKQFESLFARMMLKSMREANFGDPLLGSDQQDFYQGMFDDQLAVEMSKGRGLGLADMLVQQLTKAGMASPENATSSPAELTGDVPFAVRAKAAAGADSASFIGSRGGVGNTGTWPPATQEDFIRQLWPAAQAAGEELGVDPKNLLAQAALESNWGKSTPCDAQGNCSFNLFGIKAGTSWSGAAVTSRTLEVENGIAVPRRERFRAYGSAEESFQDYARLLQNNDRYASALNTGTDVKAFANALQNGGYATDPSYATKVAAVAGSVSNAAESLKLSELVPMTPFTRTL